MPRGRLTSRRSLDRIDGRSILSAAGRLLKKAPITSLDRVPGHLLGVRGAPDPPGTAGLLASIADHRSRRDRERSLARDVTRMRAFHRISLLASASGTAAEIGGRILSEFARAMDLRRAEIWILGKNRRTLRPLASHGRVAASAGGDVELKRCRLARLLMRRRQALLRADAGGGAGRGPIAWGRMTTLLGLPLRDRRGPIGFLFADRGGPPFEMGARDLDLATALAGLIGEMLKSVVGREIEAKRRGELLLLNRAGRLISEEERLPVLLPRLARTVRQATRARGAVIALLDDHAREFVVAGIAGPGGRRYMGYRFPARPHRSALSPRVLQSGAAVRVDDLGRLPEVCAYWPEARSVLVLPMRSRGRTLGTLRLESLRRAAFDDEGLGAFSILAEQIGHAVRRARVIEALNRKQADLRAVSESLERRLEEERGRIARELHDELAQSMTAAKINLDLLGDRSLGASPEVRRAIQETGAVIRRAIDDSRRIAMDLRPVMLDELGLVPALRWYADHFARRTGIPVEIQANGVGGTGRSEIKTLLFRFVQEALTNVVRHARARQVRIGLTGVDGTIKAVVLDDGVGMKENGDRPQGLGLLGMRERIERAGGRLTITSRPGRGTRLEVRLPQRATA